MLIKMSSINNDIIKLQCILNDLKRIQDNSINTLTYIVDTLVEELGIDDKERGLIRYINPDSDKLLDSIRDGNKDTICVSTKLLVKVGYPIYSMRKLINDIYRYTSLIGCTVNSVFYHNFDIINGLYSDEFEYNGNVYKCTNCSNSFICESTQKVGMLNYRPYSTRNSFNIDIETTFGYMLDFVPIHGEVRFSTLSGGHRQYKGRDHCVAILESNADEKLVLYSPTILQYIQAYHSMRSNHFDDTYESYSFTQIVYSKYHLDIIIEFKHIYE